MKVYRCSQHRSRCPTVSDVSCALLCARKTPLHPERYYPRARIQWCVANKRRIGIHSLEIYGDWSDDPAKLETTIQYMLALTPHSTAVKV